MAAFGFSICLNNLHPLIKYIFGKAKLIVENSESCQVINFLDVSVILHMTVLLKQTYIIKTPTPMITSLTTTHTEITLKIKYRTI